MPSAKSLIGVGVPAAQANTLGFTVSSKTAVGTAQTGAVAITTNFTILTTASGQTAAVLPATEIGGGPYIIANISATTALIFPPSGGAIQGGSTDASFSLAQNKTAMFFKTTATAWVANLSA
jgi:hypothetical protein